MEQAGRRAVLASGDVKEEAFCNGLIERAVSELGGLNILVNNAAHQRSFENIEDITAEDRDVTFRTNIYSIFYLCRAAVAHLKPGSAIINTSSINATSPWPHLLAYATTKGAIANFTAGLGQLLAKKGIRVNAVAPGPIWTPLIPSTMPPEAVEKWAKTRPWAGQASLRNWRGPMSCWRPMREAT